MRRAIALAFVIALLATQAVAWPGYDRILVGTVQEVNETAATFTVRDDGGQTWQVAWTEGTKFLTTPRSGLRLKIAYDPPSRGGGPLVALRVGLAKKG